MQLCKLHSQYRAREKVILAGGFENGEEVKAVSNLGVDNLTDLYSDQEEADTRLVFHAIHVAESHSGSSSDVVLLVYYSSQGMFGSLCTLDTAQERGMSQSVQLQGSLAQHFVLVCLHATPSQVVIPHAACTELGRELLLTD